MEESSEIPIIRVINGLVEEKFDQVATEASFALIVNDFKLLTFQCTPKELEALAVGFLLSEGLLPDRHSLRSVLVDGYNIRLTVDQLPGDWKKLLERKTLTSGCGSGVTFSDVGKIKRTVLGRSSIKISARQVLDLFKEFGRISALYRDTGGVHSAAFATPDGITLFAEDVGRHNAVDKLIGKAFFAGNDITDMMLLTSGRVSGEIMTKVIRNNISILISRAAPTCMSVAAAEDNGVTLIGFARGNRMNIYTHPLAVTIDEPHG